MLLMPATTVMLSSVGLTVTTGNLSAEKPTTMSTIVAGLDDRADARDLVHLDRDRAEARRDLDVDDRPLPSGEVRAVTRLVRR